MTDTHPISHGDSRQGAAHGHGDRGRETEHGEHGHGTTGQYLTVFGALCGLTLISFVTFRLLHTTSLEVTWAVMMAVSCMKALLVMLFFMHLKWEASWKYVLTIPATIMALFLIIALVPDVKWRLQTIAGGRTPSEERLRHVGYPAPESAAAHKAGH